MTGDGDHHGYAARGDDHILAGVRLAAALHHPVRLQACLAGDHRDAALLQQEADAVDQLGADLALALLYLRVVEAARLREDLLFHQSAELPHGAGLIHQIFGGDAADVQAGAAQMLLFKERCLQTLAGCRNGQRIAAGAAADDENIKCFHGM